MSVSSGKSCSKSNNNNSKTQAKRNVKNGDKPASERTFVDHTYHDHLHDSVDLPSTISLSTGEVKPKKAPRGGVTVSFPEKLHEMLSVVVKEGLEDIVSWQPHGRCFLVRKKNEFVDDIMPRFFSQSKLTSFQRQLNLYGFIRLTAGNDRGAYYHELFLRGRSDLCRRMARTRVKGNGMKAASSPATEPDFYVMESCPETYEVQGFTTSTSSPSFTAVSASESCTAAVPAMALMEPLNESNKDDVVPDGEDVSDYFISEPMANAYSGGDTCISDSCSIIADDVEDFPELDDMIGYPESAAVFSMDSMLPPMIPSSASSTSLASATTDTEESAAVVSLPCSPKDPKCVMSHPAHPPSIWMPVPEVQSSFVNASSTKLAPRQHPRFAPPVSPAVPVKEQEVAPPQQQQPQHYPQNGDEVFFEGLKFRYLDRLEMDVFMTESAASSSYTSVV